MTAATVIQRLCPRDRYRPFAKAVGNSCGRGGSSTCCTAFLVCRLLYTLRWDSDLFDNRTAFCECEQGPGNGLPRRRHLRGITNFVSRVPEFSSDGSEYRECFKLRREFGCSRCRSNRPLDM